MKKSIPNEIFDALDKWREFPAYQLERRADIFFAIYLKRILGQKFETEITKIIPEFPIRKGFINDDEDNLSTKIDYLAISEESNTVYLIELKTENKSIDYKQLLILLKSQESGIVRLIDELLKIYEVSQSKEKYIKLFKELDSTCLIQESYGGYKNSKKSYKIEVVYILPSDPPFRSNNKIIEPFKKVKKIYFKHVIETLEKDSDSFTKRFCESLEKWKYKV